MGLRRNVSENPGDQTTFLLGRADGQGPLAPSQCVQGNDPALDIQAGPRDIEVCKNRAGNHPHISAPGKAIEVALGARLVDRPGDELGQGEALLRAKDEEREHGQSAFLETGVEGARSVRVASGAEEYIAPAHQVSLRHAFDLEAGQARGIYGAVRRDIAELDGQDPVLHLPDPPANRVSDLDGTDVTQFDGAMSFQGCFILQFGHLGRPMIALSVL